jgi:hypothetical protein
VRSQRTKIVHVLARVPNAPEIEELAQVFFWWLLVIAYVLAAMASWYRVCKNGLANSGLDHWPISLAAMRVEAESFGRLGSTPPRSRACGIADANRPYWQPLYRLLYTRTQKQLSLF